MVCFQNRTLFFYFHVKPKRKRAGNRFIPRPFLLQFWFSFPSFISCGIFWVPPPIFIRLLLHTSIFRPGLSYLKGGPRVSISVTSPPSHAARCLAVSPVPYSPRYFSLWGMMICSFPWTLIHSITNQNPSPLLSGFQIPFPSNPPPRSI